MVSNLFDFFSSIKDYVNVMVLRTKEKTNL